MVLKNNDLMQISNNQRKNSLEGVEDQAFEIKSSRQIQKDNKRKSLEQNMKQHTNQIKSDKVQLQNAKRNQQTTEQQNQNHDLNVNQNNEGELSPIQTNQFQQQNRILQKTQSQNKLLLIPKNFNEQQDEWQQSLFKHHQNSINQKTYQLKGNSNQNLILSNYSTKECTYCNKTLSLNICSALLCKINYLGLKIQNGLSKKYSTNRDYYNVKIVNDLIYNENTHVVSIFKDYLILDDINEFLKRQYNHQETTVRLPKLCSFYDRYSQVFPNYVILPESKYMFKNIQKKQKLIDEQYQFQEQQKKMHQSMLDDDKMFNSQFYKSLCKHNDISMSKVQYEIQAQAIQQSKIKLVQEMRIEDLVENFIVRDSESNINMVSNSVIEFTQSTIALEKTPNKQDKQPFHNSNQQFKQIEMVQQRYKPQTKNVKKQPLVKQQQKQKASFKQNNIQVKKVDTSKHSNKYTTSGSQKTTPRLQKNSPITQSDKTNQIYTSPNTKDAMNNYLQHCQIDLTGQMGPKPYKQQNIYESPPPLSQSNQKTQVNQQQSQTKMISSISQQNLRSQQVRSQQQITNLKKNQKILQKKPQQNFHQIQPLSNSRNGFQTTQKSLKSINSNGKYLTNQNQVAQQQVNQQDYDNDLVTGDDVADERFASPQNNIFTTDEMKRRSFENKNFILTSQDERALSQCNNYDQIKKHLEKYINNQQSQETLNTVGSASKQQTQDQMRFGYNKSQLAQSHPTNNEAGSRNIQQQKHFESLKQQVKGVFDQIDNMKQQELINNQIQQQYRMSLEQNDIKSLQQKGCLSSTSQNGRTLSFSQNAFLKDKAALNLKQRKQSGKQYAQIKQSFKDINQKVIKKSSTNKNLQIQDVQNHTFGQQQLQYVQSTQNIINNQQQPYVQQSKYNQNQAANTVRVMTPSYSLASLSKIISPTTQQSPLTTLLAGQQVLNVNNRKQMPRKNQNNHQHMPSTFIQTATSKQNQIRNNQQTSKSKSIPKNQKNKQVIQQNQINYVTSPKINQEVIQIPNRNVIMENSQSFSCTISTENINQAAKTLESKNPKFMKTIQEIVPSNNNYKSLGNKKPSLTQINEQKNKTNVNKQQKQNIFNYNQYKSPISQLQNKKNIGFK